jgi:hypothetical protein
MSPGEAQPSGTANPMSREARTVATRKMTRQECGRKGYANGLAKASQAQRTRWARLGKYGKSLGKRTPEQRSAAGKKGYANGIGRLSPEERHRVCSEAGKKGAAARWRR